MESIMRKVVSIKKINNKNSNFKNKKSVKVV